MRITGSSLQIPALLEKTVQLVLLAVTIIRRVLASRRIKIPEEKMFAW
jgi:hypothetical protein